MAKMLVLDANLPRSLTGELTSRGMDAENLHRLNIDGYKDPQMLRRLRKLYDPATLVLVTCDDLMPQVHGSVVAEVGFPIATVDGRWNYWGHAGQDQYRRDMVHRFAHQMAEQTEKEIWRYSPSGRKPWKPKSKK